MVVGSPENRLYLDEISSDDGSFMDFQSCFTV